MPLAVVSACPSSFLGIDSQSSLSLGLKEAMVIGLPNSLQRIYPADGLPLEELFHLGQVAQIRFDDLQSFRIVDQLRRLDDIRRYDPQTWEQLQEERRELLPNEA